jgi:ribonuclease BN (tRNA processing enzyme)
MRLTVLGGAAASPNTGMGCSGYLVESGDTRLLIDPGPGTLLELRKHADFRALSAVIVSHMHLDHMLDLLALRHALAYNPVQPAGPTPVLLPPGGALLLARACAPFDECDEPGTFDATVVVAEYDPAGTLALGELTVLFAPTVHYLPAWAMRLTGPAGSCLGFTADTGPASNMAGFFDRVEVLLAEATLLSEGDRPLATRGSLTAKEAGQLASDSGVQTLILTHYWEEHDPQLIRTEAASKFDGRIVLARPGVAIEWM